MIPGEDLVPSEFGLVGPSTILTVAGVVDDGGQMNSIGADLQVLLVDMDFAVSTQLRLAEEMEPVAVTFSEEDQYAYPDPGELVAKTRSWIREIQSTGEGGWYTPEVTAAEGDSQSEGRLRLQAMQLSRISCSR